MKNYREIYPISVYAGTTQDELVVLANWIATEVKKEEREKILTEIERLITKEMSICYKEKQPTSRLTSLHSEISKLRCKDL